MKRIWIQLYLNTNKKIEKNLNFAKFKYSEIFTSFYFLREEDTYQYIYIALSFAELFLSCF